MVVPCHEHLGVGRIADVAVSSGTFPRFELQADVTEQRGKAIGVVDPEKIEDVFTEPGILVQTGPNCFVVIVVEQRSATIADVAKEPGFVAGIEPVLLRRRIERPPSSSVVAERTSTVTYAEPIRRTEVVRALGVVDIELARDLVRTESSDSTVVKPERASADDREEIGVRERNRQVPRGHTYGWRIELVKAFLGDLRDHLPAEAALAANFRSPEWLKIVFGGKKPHTLFHTIERETIRKSLAEMKEKRSLKRAPQSAARREDFPQIALNFILHDIPYPTESA